MYIYIYIHITPDIHIYTHIDKHMYINVCVHVYTYVCVYALVHIHLVCVCVRLRGKTTQKMVAANVRKTAMIPLCPMTSFVTKCCHRPHGSKAADTVAAKQRNDLVAHVGRASKLSMKSSGVVACH